MSLFENKKYIEGFRNAFLSKIKRDITQKKKNLESDNQDHEIKSSDTILSFIKPIKKLMQKK